MEAHRLLLPWSSQDDWTYMLSGACRGEATVYRMLCEVHQAHSDAKENRKPQSSPKKKKKNLGRPFYRFTSYLSIHPK